MQDHRDAIVVSANERRLVGYLKLRRRKGDVSTDEVLYVMPVSFIDHIQEKIVLAVVAVSQEKVKLILVGFTAHDPIILLNGDIASPLLLKSSIQSDEVNLIFARTCQLAFEKKPALEGGDHVEKFGP